VFGLTIPLLVADLTYILLTSTDAVLLGYFRGTTEVAAFRAVQPAAKLNEVVSSSFLILFTPVASRLFARGDRGAIKDLYWKTATWIAVFTFPIFVVTFALARPFTVLVFGDRYSSSGTLLAVLAVGYYLQVAVGFNGTVLMVMGKMKLVVGAGLVAVAANVALDLVLIPRYGAMGAAVGTSSALVIYNLLKQVALRVGAGVPVFDRRYLRVYATIACGAASVALVEHELQLELLTALPLALAASVLVLRLNRRSLAVAETFPELRRLPLARRIFGE
jgi:O-antigen/teichoic acid export membrane protein